MELLSVTMHQNSSPNLEENYIINVPIDTIYSGKLYWNLSCELITHASQNYLDSIALNTFTKSFDTCRITVIEHMLEVESRSCYSYKATQIKDELQTLLPSGIVFVTTGEAILSEDKKSTIVIVEIF